MTPSNESDWEPARKADRMERTAAMRRVVYGWLLLAAISSRAAGQAESPLPYDPRLITDQTVGNIEGVQRFGHRPKTDPEVGVGYGYQVFPRWILGGGGNVVEASNVAFDALTWRFEEVLAAARKFIDNPADANIRTEMVRSAESLEMLAGAVELQSTGAAARAAHAIVNYAANLKTDVDVITSPEEMTPQTREMWLRRLRSIGLSIGTLQRNANSVSVPVAGAALAQPFSQPFSDPIWAGWENPPALQPFSATAGMRNLAADPFAVPVGPAPAGYLPYAQVVAFEFKDGKPVYRTMQLFHQPLIQVKVRVVEVSRADSFQASSVLDYIGDSSVNDSLFTGHNINNNGRKTSGVTRFPAPIGIAPNTMFPAGIEAIQGSGALLNLTTDHINLLTSLLAAEFSADVVTAPEVVTLNGQNVEFVAGSKMPFALGLDMVQGESTTTTNFFYKNVGTYISVTPRIVNWGKHAEMSGKTPLVATEIANWNRLIEWILGSGHVQLPKAADPASKEPPLTIERLTPYAKNNLPVPYDVRRDILKELSKYPGDELRSRMGPPLNADADMHRAFHTQPQSGGAAAIRQAQVQRMGPEILPLPGLAGEQPILRVPSGVQCDWRPEECTIDLEIVVRLSDTAASGVGISLQRGEETEDVDATKETNIRAVANVLQIASGHGVVMSGLIGESDTEAVAKIPVLGDVPVVGYLFRSKATTREKKETLIFVEAKVLPNPDQARFDSGYDFGLSQPYIQGELLDSPLEFGLYRAGFGTYLPPHSCDERVFWERFSRKVRKACTEFDDAIE
jgi:hypothetical protein